MEQWINRVHFGDCLETLRRMPDGIVNTCVTSPPYFGLRSYLPDGHEDKALEIGAEESPEEFVAALVEVFREVRRVLRDDGTAWVNLGDSFARNPAKGQHKPGDSGKQAYIYDRGNGRASSTSMGGLPEKNLLGIPWAVAKALQAPYYTGQIKSEADRVWLAAIIDGEGCFFIHKRKAGTRSYSKFTRADGSEADYVRTADTYGVGLEICNTHKAIIDRVQEIAGLGSITTQSPQQNARRKQTIYRWRIGPNEVKRLARELYPHLVAKQHQARLIFNCPSTGEAGAAAHQAMMDLHNGVATAIDYPPPPSMFEPGWILRQDIIWEKNNPMPESVRDRCTKAHEYIFLLSKQERYYFDADAVREPYAEGSYSADVIAKAGKAGGNRPPGNNFNKQARHEGGESTPATRAERAALLNPLGRNRRSVWTVATKPYSGAHFATFPPELIEPCILAGAPPGGVVLDPFFGSGTSGEVAQRLGRAWIGCELNPDYKPLQDERLQQPGLVLEA